MKLVIEVDLDNAAFEQDGEIQNVLNQVAHKMSSEVGGHGSLKDSNGNTVGNWSVEP